MLPQPVWPADRRRRRFEFTRRALIPVIVIPVAIAGAVAINALANVSSTVRDDRFDLTMTTPKASYRVEEPIPLSATLTYLGPEENVELSSEYRDSVYFSLEQLDGPLDMDGGGSRLICYPTSLAKAEPDTIAFSKSGAFSSETPGASFWASYFADPTLRIPGLLAGQRAFQGRRR